MVVGKSTSSKFLIFGGTLKKARRFVVKYRTSNKAKALLKQWFPRRLPGYVTTRWWTDVQMLRVLLEVAECPDKPLEKLYYAMGWGIQFTAQEIEHIRVFVRIMDPMERIFSSLNSEKESTIHLCYPTVLVRLIC